MARGRPASPIAFEELKRGKLWTLAAASRPLAAALEACIVFRGGGRDVALWVARSLPDTNDLHVVAVAVVALAVAARDNRIATYELRRRPDRVFCLGPALQPGRLLCSSFS